MNDHFYEPNWPIAVMMFERDISKQLSDRNFMFEKLSVMTQRDEMNLKTKLLVIIDGCSEEGCYSKSRQILYSHVLPDEITNYVEMVNDICNGIIDSHPNRVRYRKYKVYCQHCGAPIQINEEACPYCGQPYVEFNFKEEVKPVE